MYKSVKAYFDAVRAADKAQEEHNAAAKAAYDAAMVAAGDDYTRRDEASAVLRSNQRAAQTLRTAQEAAAWARLYFAEEAAVAWIARNCESYKDHCRIVFRALKPTSTAADMREVARKGTWCTQFDDYLIQARNAGVFADEISQERLTIIRWVKNQVGDSARYANEMERMLDALVSAEGPAAVAAAIAAAAEQEVPEAVEPELVEV